MAKYHLRMQARDLRNNGFSIKEIAKKLLVSTSTASLWVRDIMLTEEQYRTLELNGKNPFYGRRLEYINRIKEETNNKVLKLKAEGVVEVGELSRRELLLVGSALYWSEGFKKDSQAGFANSDPKMINFFLKWLKVCFGYKNEDLIPRVSVNIAHKDRIKIIEEFWSSETGIPTESFRKPFYQNVKWAKIYDNPNDYYGLLRIKVRKSKDFLRKIHGFIEGLRMQATV